MLLSVIEGSCVLLSFAKARADVDDSPRETGMSVE